MCEERKECPERNSCIAYEEGCSEDMDDCFWRTDHPSKNKMALFPQQSVEVRPT